MLHSDVDWQWCLQTSVQRRDVSLGSLYSYPRHLTLYLGSLSLQWTHWLWIYLECSDNLFCNVSVSEGDTDSGLEIFI